MKRVEAAQEGGGCDVGLAQRPLRPGFLIQLEPAEQACLFLAGRLGGEVVVKPFQKIIIIKTLI